ncbi:uncharacterized protein MONBRDRAFT_27090 [Monosiga brevicollis MX1]|uniref:C-type lectin domain-containing protein n=1 Tax=Monosiga brevicollis TaxID=81824 RepID=A9V499_MONBE|nr:uncharacterized protein MONBRDRAFT_27090 [Monosiga brevicollis MX1]EDQ87581.1 predicted protein [Monosiga brevicollis MX1]|eukprot:XP_001747501.1 hypothetical protein [Monosiga brevicollis MX1]
MALETQSYPQNQLWLHRLQLAVLLFVVTHGAGSAVATVPPCDLGAFVIASNDKQYLLVNTVRHSWVDAAAHCVSLNARLANPVAPTDFAAITSVYHASPKKSFWVGGRIASEAPPLLDFASVFVNPATIPFQGSLGGDERCIQYNSFARVLQPKACRKRRFFLCERSSPATFCATHPATATTQPQAPSIIQLPGTFSFDDAAAACQSLGHELAAPHNQAELNAIVQALHDDKINMAAEFWLGMKVDENIHLVFQNSTMAVDISQFTAPAIKTRWRNCGLLKIQQANSGQLQTNRCNRRNIGRYGSSYWYSIATTTSHIDTYFWTPWA